MSEPSRTADGNNTLHSGLYLDQLAQEVVFSPFELGMNDGLAEDCKLCLVHTQI